MNLGRAAGLAEGELAEAKRRYPQLQGWRFAWNKRKTSFGLCRFKTSTVELSLFLTSLENDEAEVIDTVRHEIAHALAGAKAGHGSEWQRWAKRLGARPRARRPLEGGQVQPRPRYVLVAHIDGEEQVVKRYYHRPPTRFIETLPTRWVAGRPETKGTLRLREVTA